MLKNVVKKGVPVVFHELVNRQISSVIVDFFNSEVYFILKCLDTGNYSLLVAYHEQDCCETVELLEEDPNLEKKLKKMCGERIVSVSEKIVDISDEVSDDSGTATFYDLRSHAGETTFRWHGESNGYYSERVDFCDLCLTSEIEKDLNKAYRWTHNSAVIINRKPLSKEY